MVGEGVLGTVAATGTSTLVADERAALQFGGGVTEGSLIAVPLRLEGEVIGVLAAGAAASDCFSEQDLRLLELVGERLALAIGQAELREREQRLAETLQRTMLPQSLPAVPGVQLAARYVPQAASVGGDFYDAVALPSGALGVAIGDVTGKGLRAAAAMGRLRSALHAYALDRTRPADVLHRLGRLAEVDGAMATALYLVLDPRSGGMELASAGHLPPLRISSGGAEFLPIGDALSPPLGWSVAARRQTWHQLTAGSTLVLYTDGLVERTHDLDDGMSRLAGAAATASEGSVDELCEHLVATLAPQGRYHDDVAVLALRLAS
jgi:phosphoserine phosphatase RsbU/P